MKQEGCRKCKYAETEITDLPCKTCRALPIKWKYTHFEAKEQVAETQLEE